MQFTKMHGLGNDYLYIYGEVPADAPQLAIQLSDRHFGVGSDGIIYITQSLVADFGMRIFNADGSEAQMCGNGIRCVGKYVYDKGFTNKTSLDIETKAGIKQLELTICDGKVVEVAVNMGVAQVFDDKDLLVDGVAVTCTPVSVGNPHAVIFVDDADKSSVAELGPLIERHPVFPEGTNVEFAQMISEHEIRMRVWERGSGITMACGTGTCATVAAAVSKGLCAFGDDITVHLDGGPLRITVNQDYEIVMVGPATTVFEGEVAL